MPQHTLKIMALIGVMIIISISIMVLKNYPYGVSQYHTIALGMKSAEGVGSPTVWASPYRTVPESYFYVYSIGDEQMCIGSDCGIGGYFVECLGGWISGEKIITEEFDYGLRDAGVDIKKVKVITVANKDAKVVGIYPGARIKNLPYIMRNHRDLVSNEVFEGCLDLLPRRWK